MITLMQTYNVDIIKSVMFVDEIWDAVTEDHHAKEDFIPNLSTSAYYEILDGDVLLGLLAMDHVNSITQRVHPMIIPEHRNRSKDICRQMIDMWCDSTDYKKLIAEIPSCYPHVIGFAEFMGFKPEGIRTKSFIRNGDIIDIHLFGATIEELKKWA